jgi:L-lactate dehydrogenase complex protein LldG
VAVAVRDELLARVRAALRDAPEPPPVPRGYRRRAEVADPVALFAERVADYRATVTRSNDPVAAIEAALARHGARRVAIAPGLPWRPDGVELVEDRGLTPHELDALDGVVTGCAVAIAETGTLVPTGRRAITLVPDLHVCVVEPAQVVVTVPEAIARLGPPDGPVTFVSGPSATSDIELSRVEGVHGPRRLEVIVSAP